jgi:acyl-CoA reductase-like NAD-dependent aldehyde dehydrogenase
LSAATATDTIYRQFINGLWVEPGDTFDDLNPYTGEVWGKVAAATPDDMHRAISAASDAFPAWAAMGALEKQGLFLRAADLIDERAAMHGAIVTAEAGLISAASSHVAGMTAQILRRAATWVTAPKGEVLTAPDSDVVSVAVRRPLGVVGVFTPWNGATLLAWRAVAQTLAAGNTVVLKPSELAPVSVGLLLAEVADAAGFPKGVLNVVTNAPGEGGAIADPLFERDEVRSIFFIGSVPTGRMLAARAAGALKRSVMELGGYNPLIILEDTDTAFAVRTAIVSAFGNQGQVCFNSRKILIARSKYDEFLAAFATAAAAMPTGDPADPKTAIGPLINDAAVARVQHRIKDAVEHGARIVTGGSFTGRVHEPTILADVPAVAEASHEETFGPMVIVEPFDDVDEAVQIANATEFGLSSAVLSRDAHRAAKVGERLRVGITHVNGPTLEDSIEAPIGGVGASGWGRHGDHAVEDLTDLIWMNVRSHPDQDARAT